VPKNKIGEAKIRFMLIPTKKFLKNLHRLFLDILFPITCAGCGKENKWLCESCLAKIIIKEEQICPLCEKVETPDGRICFSCKKRSSLDGLLVCASYKEKIIPKLVHHFKYRFIADLGAALGKIAVKKILSSYLLLPDLLIPVPLHSKRLRWRGFNQSLLLAKQISKKLTPGIEISILENILIRTKHTRAQMKIKSHHDRRKNIQNAFLITDPQAIRGRTIFLIDDIATTGATLFECAKVLKSKGAREVFAVVVARQEIKR